MSEKVTFGVAAAAQQSTASHGHHVCSARYSWDTHPTLGSSWIPKKFPPTRTQQDPQGPTGSGVSWKLWDGAGKGDSTNPV